MLKNDQNIALKSVQKKKMKASKGSGTENQNKIQTPGNTWSWSEEAWEARKAEVTSGGSSNPLELCIGTLGGANMEPYVYVRLLKPDREALRKDPKRGENAILTSDEIKAAKTGLADKTNSVSVVNEQAIFQKSDMNELLEECLLTTKTYKNPGDLCVFLRVYDDDVGDDECLGQAIVDINEVVKSGKELFASIPVYDEEHGEMICHCEMSAQWKPVDGDQPGGYVNIKIFRLFDFRDDIDSDEGTQACKYLLYFLIYILIGAGLFKAFEEPTWGCNAYFDAIWFMVITITSVGYGDCFPETNGTKVLNFFMIITNILCIGWMFSIAVQQMIVMQEKLERKLMGSIQNTMWNKGEGDDMEPAGIDKHDEPMTRNDDFRTTTIMCVVLIILTCLVLGANGDETCMVQTVGDDGTTYSAGSCPADPTNDAGESLCTTVNTEPGGKCPATGICCMGRDIGAGFMNFWDVLQFTVVTMATVGYGDVSPSTVWGKVYGMFFAMIGVAALARLGALVVDNVMDAAHQAKMEKILGQTLTSLDELAVFDKDGDGKIDKFEFLEKMLVMTHECSQDTIDRIMGRFYQIDVDQDGDIDGEDFKALLQNKKNKVKSPRGNDELNFIQDA